MINWQVRAKSKTFWLALIPGVLLLVEQVAALIGYSLDLAVLGGQLNGIIDTVFMLLTLMGVIVDPTTKGVGDSDQALKYTEPK